MTTQIANMVTALGISLTIFGAIILYRFGPPARPITDGMLIFLVRPNSEEERIENRRVELSQIRYAKAGLSMTIAGGAIQILAIFLAIYLGK